jgi:hypothetical protein
MVDILNNRDEKSAEYSLVKKFRQMSEELGQLRLNTIASVRIDEKGTLSAVQSPGLTALQEKIAEEEQKLNRMAEIAKEIGATLDEIRMPSCAALAARRAECDNTIHSGPLEAWQAFNLARGEGGIGEKMRIYWLPSDICQVPEYKEQEGKIRAKIEAAKTAIEPLTVAGKHIDALMEEARVL